MIENGLILLIAVADNLFNSIADFLRLGLVSLFKLRGMLSILEHAKSLYELKLLKKFDMFKCRVRFEISLLDN